MSIRDLKRQVTRYFRWRKKTLQTIGGKKIGKDDFFELYVLARTVKQIKPAPTLSRTKGKKFVIAASPSGDWLAASYFEIVNAAGQRRGLRSGLEVHGAGTAELDVALVRLPGGDETADPPTIKGIDVDGAFECKALKGPVGSGDANEMVGKAFRLWKLPVPGFNGVQRYALVSLSGVVPNAANALAPAGLVHYRSDDTQLEVHFAALMKGLSS